MADNDATRELFRELLGMTSGGTAGGRGSMSIPDDIMDSLAGDAAQESLARDRLIMEMRKAESQSHDPRFVSLDLMEMEADQVDTFLKSARKKIIKRSKPTRKACCAKIGGVLDQIMGPVGGDVDTLELQGVRDRGKMDPIGDVDSVDEACNLDMKGKKKSSMKGFGYPGDEDEGDSDGDGGGDGGAAGESVDGDLLNFIAEEFFHFEHDGNCPLSDPNFTLEHDPLAEAKWIQGAIKKPGALRDHYGVSEGEEVPLEKARADYERLAKKAEGEGTLTGDEMKLFKRLQLFLKVLKPASAKKQEEAYGENTMEPSRTAFALSAFMEAKGSPDPGMMRVGDDAGDLSYKTRDDNKEYPTDLMPAKSGGKKTAGEPKPAKGGHTPRWEKGADPIGEDDLHEGSMRMSRAPGMDPARKFYKMGQQAARNVARKLGEPPMAPGEAAMHGARDVINRRPGARLGKSHQEPLTLGPEESVSTTAIALSNFMESVITAKTLKGALGGDAGDLNMGTRDDVRGNLGGPLEKFAGKRGGLDVYDEGGKKMRGEKDANPIGGAVPSEQGSKRMKK